MIYRRVKILLKALMGKNFKNYNLCVNGKELKFKDIK